MNKVIFAITGTILPLLVSCGTNVFTSVPMNQPHAIIKPEVTLGNFLVGSGTTQILEIDGKKPSYWRMSDTYRVTPGKHTLGLIGLERGLNSMSILDFLAREGKVYIAKSDQAGGLKMKFWIEEKDTKTIVATSMGNLQVSPQSSYTPIFIPISN